MLAEFIPWNRFLGSVNVQKYGLRLCSLRAGRYNNPIPTRFLVRIDCLIKNSCTVYIGWRNRFLDIGSSKIKNTISVCGYSHHDSHKPIIGSKLRQIANTTGSMVSVPVRKYAIFNLYHFKKISESCYTLAQELVAVITNQGKKSLGGLKENHFCPNLLQPTLPSAANTARMFTSYYYLPFVGG